MVFIETKLSLFWWNFHYWQHWKLSFWQLPVQPVLKISSRWWHFLLNVIWMKLSPLSKSMLLFLQNEIHWYLSTTPDSVFRDFWGCLISWWISNGVDILELLSFQWIVLGLFWSEGFYRLKNEIYVRHSFVLHLLEFQSYAQIRLDWEPWGRLNKKDGLTRYGDSHVKDKTS